MRRIAFINEKGGTGKTTLAVNVAAYLAQKKQRRVLLVDLDTQGHAAKSLGIDSREASPNVFHLLTDDAVTLADVARPTAVPNLTVVPSWKEMAEFPTVAAADPQRARRLARRLVPGSGYELVIFDAPPSMGLATTNILVAASEVVIPVATTYLALDGCAEMLDTVRRVAETFEHPSLFVSLVVPTMYRKTQLADEVVGKLREHFPGRVTEPLGLNVAIDEAQSHGKTIWEYAPWSRGATMLQAVGEAVARA
ncbi:MAG: ParA family protein, partial [Deltaproteobacteria bacterium]|nr:ParA family protein [Deltaproteobacteria bacterium]